MAVRFRSSSKLATLMHRVGLRQGGAALAALSLLIVSCSKDATAPKAAVASVTIAGAPTDNAVIVGSTAQLTATVKDANSAVLSGRTVTWLSSNAATATVSATGLVTAVSSGLATVTATSEGISSSLLMSLRVEVTPPAAGGATTTTALLGGNVTMVIPPAVVPAGVKLNVATAAAAPAAPAGQTVAAAYDFGPSGTMFSAPITITLKYEKSLITTVDDRLALKIYLASGTSWVAENSSVVDTVAGTVSAQVSHFSTYGVLPPPKPATMAVKVGSSQTAPVSTAVAVAPSVLLSDLNNQPVKNATVVFAAASGGGSVTGATVKTGSDGVATVGSWTLGSTAGANTLTATITSTTAATVAPITFTATGQGPATQLALATQPGGASSGVAMTTQPVVEVRDALGGKYATSTASVTVAVASGTATLSGTTTVSAVAGVATFTNLKLTGAAGNVTLTFTSTGLTAATSGTIALAQTATAVVVTTLPSTDVFSGVVLPQQPVLGLRDAGGIAVAAATNSITATVSPSTATLSGTATVAAVNGVATFTNLVLTGPAGAYTLSFAGTGLTSATAPVNIAAPQDPTALALVTAPSTSAVAGAALAVQPVIELRDSKGAKVIGSTKSVTVNVLTGNGVLTGTTTVNAVNGTATFTNLAIVGTSVSTLQFTSTLVSAVATGNITITPVLAFATVPNGAATGGVLTQQPVVEIRDNAGNKITKATDNVVVTLQSATGTLSGTTTVAAVAGVATFTDLKITGVGATNTLTFTSVGTTVVSSNIVVSAAAPSKLTLTTQPAGASSGVVLTTQPVVEVRDAIDAKFSASTVNVVASIASGNATLSGTTSVAAVAGVATFTNLKVSGAAGNVTLQFSSGSLTAATSGTIALTQTPSALAVTTAPTANAFLGVALAQQPVIAVRDAAGLTVGAATTSVTATVSAGATLTGTTTVAAVAGVATFTNLAIGGTAGAYTLTFAATGLTSATATGTTTASVASVAVTLGSATLNGNAKTTATPVVKDGANNVMTFPVTWTSSNPMIARVASDGSVQALGTGTSVITATAAGTVTGSATLTVTQQTAAFNVIVRPFGPTMSATVLKAFTDAATQWSRTIRGALPSVALNALDISDCLGQKAGTTPTLITETIQNLVIYAKADSIDGQNGTLASAGPCYQRGSSSLAFLGQMVFDTADIAGMIANGSLYGTVLHEMGHVLGIGTIWEEKGLLQDKAPSAPDPAGDPIFTGVNTLWTFANLGTGYTGRPVPVENGGSAGTRNGHWRESILRDELMTGYDGPTPGGRAPLSPVTAASLLDIGYTVDLSESDKTPWFLREPGDVTMVRGREIIETPLKFTPVYMDANGRVVSKPAKPAPQN